MKTADAPAIFICACTSSRMRATPVSDVFKFGQFLLILPAQLLWKSIKVIRPLCHLRERRGGSQTRWSGSGRWKFWHQQKHVGEPLVPEWRAVDIQALNFYLFIPRPYLKVGFGLRLRAGPRLAMDKILNWSGICDVTDANHVWEKRENRTTGFFKLLHSFLRIRANCH